MAEAFFLQAGKGRHGNALKVLYQVSTQGPAEFQVAGGHVILCVC